MRTVLYLFGLLSDDDVEWLARAGTRRPLADAEVLIAQGRPAGHVALLLEGRLRVSAEGLGEIARLRPGEIVGEMSLVDSAPPSATVGALGSAQVLVVDKAVLQAELDRNEGFAARFYRALAVFLADRLRAAHPGRATRLDDDAIAEDELDEGIIDRVSAAGERFNRLLRLLGGAPAAAPVPLGGPRGR